MSHFCVIVTNTLEENYESQLEPFYEQGEEGDYFMEKEIEVRAEDVPTEALEIMRKTADRIKELEAKPDKDEGNINWLNDLKSSLETYQKLHDEGKDVEIVKEYMGYEQDEDGNFYSVYNPQAKWDWYEVGGRWSGYFKLKDNAPDTPVVGGHYSMTDEQREKLVEDRRTDVACVGEIDWEGMRKENLRKAEGWWADYQVDLLKPEKDRKHPYFQWGIEKEDTKETYLRRQGSLAPFAVLDNGEWYERGSMGWWGVVSDENDDWDKEFEAILAKWVKENKDMELTLVDCHI